MKNAVFEYFFSYSFKNFFVYHENFLFCFWDFFLANKKIYILYK